MLMKNDKVSKLTVIQKTFSSHWLRPHSLQNTHTHWHVFLRLRNKLPTMRVKMENRGQATSINYSWNFLLNYPMLLSRKFIILYIPWNFFHHHLSKRWGNCQNCSLIQKYKNGNIWNHMAEIKVFPLHESVWHNSLPLWVFCAYRWPTGLGSPSV